MNQKEIKQNIVDCVNRVKAENPMAGSITNTVTINFVANAQLAVGGSAAMVYLPDEAEGLALAGNALYINVGTLFPVYSETLPRAAKTLHDAGKAWVLDPVAIGLGSMRTQLLYDFKEYKPTIVRGNASEIISLAKLWGLDEQGETGAVRGVDSTDTVEAAKNAAVQIARYTGGAAAVSGETDLVTDGHMAVRSHGGSLFMPMITGTGCSLGGVTAVYATSADPFTAALTAANVYNLAGARAEKDVPGPGSFQVRFLDELYRATPEEIANNPFEVEEL